MDAPPAVAKAIQADGRVVITAEARTTPNPPASWILAPPRELLELLELLVLLVLLLPWPLLHAL
jgi:hypothetical protein